MPTIEERDGKFYLNPGADEQPGKLFGVNGGPFDTYAEEARPEYERVRKERPTGSRREGRTFGE